MIQKDERRLRKQVKLVKFPPTKTQQQFEKDTNMNIIMSNYKRGIPPKFMSRGQYADLYNAPESLAEAFQQVSAMVEEFEKLPAHIREQFKNSPEVFVNFISDPRNEAEFKEIFGIKEQPPADPVVKEPILAPETSKKSKKPPTDD